MGKFFRFWNANSSGNNLRAETRSAGLKASFVFKKGSSIIKDCAHKKHNSKICRVADIVQRLGHQFVALGIWVQFPISAPLQIFAPLAQWIRASRFGREGRRFESFRARVKFQKHAFNTKRTGIAVLFWFAEKLN